MIRNRRPDLIVPIRDRRQHKRYLTLRNARNAAIVLAVLFIAITIRSEREPRHRNAFGDLMDRQIPAPESTMPVVEEAPPVGEGVPDPMLVAPAAREQWLHDDTGTSPATIAAVPTFVPPRAGDSRLAIVGGPEGVSVTIEKRERQKLRGGFGRD